MLEPVLSRSEGMGIFCSSKGPPRPFLICVRELRISVECKKKVSWEALIFGTPPWFFFYQGMIQAGQQSNIGNYNNRGFITLKILQLGEYNILKLSNFFLVQGELNFSWHHGSNGSLDQIFRIARLMLLNVGLNCLDNPGQKCGTSSAQFVRPPTATI